MHHMKTLSLMLCLLLPAAAFADDAPVQTQLLPSEQNAPVPAVEDAKHCGMHKCGRGGGKAKWIVLTGVTATVITAAAVGIAVGVARANAQPQTR